MAWKNFKKGPVKAGKGKRAKKAKPSKALVQTIKSVIHKQTETKQAAASQFQNFRITILVLIQLVITTFWCQPLLRMCSITDVLGTKFELRSLQLRVIL